MVPRGSLKKGESNVSVSLLAISHAEQTLTLFKEGVPEGGGSSCGAAWVAEKKASPTANKPREGGKRYPPFTIKRFL